MIVVLMAQFYCWQVGKPLYVGLITSTYIRLTHFNGEMTSEFCGVAFTALGTHLSNDFRAVIHLQTQHQCMPNFSLQNFFVCVFLFENAYILQLAS